MTKDRSKKNGCKLVSGLGTSIERFSLEQTFIISSHFFHMIVTIKKSASKAVFGKQEVFTMVLYSVLLFGINLACLTQTLNCDFSVYLVFWAVITGIKKRKGKTVLHHVLSTYYLYCLSLIIKNLWKWYQSQNTPFFFDSYITSQVKHLPPSVV